MKEQQKKSHVELFESQQLLIQHELDSLELELQLILRSEVPLIKDICGYLNEAQGKRIRPAMLFLAAKCTGGEMDDVVKAAVAVELIHTATLIHDDIIDNHKLRRGKQTIRSKWGNSTATIMGDFLYSKAFAGLAGAGLFEILGILARVTHTMCIGEMMQLDQRHNVDIGEDGYMEMIHKKTASLFSAACECGALLGDNNVHSKSFSGFGENIGLAFQITDDLFDYIAVDKYIGKPTASDFSDGRVTLPFITAFRNAPERTRKWVGDLFRNGFNREEHWTEVVSFVQNYGGVEYSLQKARDFGEKAKLQLRDIDISPERDALCFAADYIVTRVRPFS